MNVDDFDIVAYNTTLKVEAVAVIQQVYTCIDIDLGFYLGMKLVQDRVQRNITISHPGYLKDLQEEFGLTSTRGHLKPMLDKPREPESESNPRVDAAGIKMYQRKVGSVLWAATGTLSVMQLATNLASHPGYLENLREEFSLTSTREPLTPMLDKPREPESESNPRVDAAGIKM